MCVCVKKGSFSVFQANREHTQSAHKTYSSRCKTDRMMMSRTTTMRETMKAVMKNMQIISELRLAEGTDFINCDLTLSMLFRMALLALPENIKQRVSDWNNRKRCYRVELHNERQKNCSALKAS